MFLEIWRADEVKRNCNSARSFMNLQNHIQHSTVNAIQGIFNWLSSYSRFLSNVFLSHLVGEVMLKKECDSTLFEFI